MPPGVGVAAQKETQDQSARRLFDVPAAVAFFQSLGAESASKNFVRSLITSGQLPHVRIGKRFFVSRESILNWISKNERRAR